MIHRLLKEVLRQLATQTHVHTTIKLLSLIPTYVPPALGSVGVPAGDPLPDRRRGRQAGPLPGVSR